MIAGGWGDSASPSKLGATPLRYHRVAFLLVVLGFGAVPAAAQDVQPPYTRGFYEAKGYYGTSYGSPSYGSVRAYSSFSSPFGAGMRYGYPPATIMPGWGAAIWRGGSNTAADQFAGSSRSYRTWAVPYVGSTPAGPLPPMGAYAPSYGPGLNGW